MASRIAQRPLVIQVENLDVNRKSKKAGFDGSVKNSKTATKKGRITLGSRKALNDITNRTSVLQEDSLQKKSTKKQGINVAEERFLHDHRKCSEEKQAAPITLFMDMVLPGHASISTVKHPKIKQVKVIVHVNFCFRRSRNVFTFTKINRRYHSLLGMSLTYCVELNISELLEYLFFLLELVQLALLHDFA
ncbi:unnamed protein product [Dovyalis caffra]|uniref:Uncharacterized protein n=1 Tax=Dovyalis caffra TaxID=77055 RepID=A0AAV1RA09_9ROSI|nr:unnamed protein product [Dovyalis caffra]